MSIVFLTVDEVLALHELQIEYFGGSAGLRSRELLESAVAQPEATFGGEYLHRAIHEMAAAYLFHLVQNHPFVDGNKRIGLAAAMTFLAANGIPLEATAEQVYDLTMRVAEGRLSKEDLAKELQGLFPLPATT